jgi:hypothetical protein
MRGDIGTLRRMAFPLSATMPDIRFRIEIGTLRRNDTKVLARGSLQYPPALHLRDPFSPERLKPSDLCLDIIGFDVDMHATWMIHGLNQDFNVFRRAGQFSIVGVRRI